LLFYRGLGFVGLVLQRMRGGALDRNPKMPPDLVRDIVLDRAGVRLFVRDAKLRQHRDDRAIGLLALARQLVNPNFPHNNVIQLDRLFREANPSLSEAPEHSPRAGADCSLTPKTLKPSPLW
jgi:hypothetical protein